MESKIQVGNNKIRNMKANMGRYVRVLRELIRLRFQRLMMFRLGFFGPFFADGSLFAVQLIVFEAVYANVDSVGSWGRGEMILYIGSFSMLNAVSMVVCFFGVNQIAHKIKSGEMDLYLTKPVSPLFRLTFEQINPGSVPLVLMSLLIILYGIRESGIVISVSRVLSYLGWMCLMQLLYYEMEVLIRAAAFYLVTNGRLDQLEEASLDLCMKLPGIAFYGIYKVVFYGLLPYGIMATLPVQSMIGDLTLPTALYGLGIVAAFSCLLAVVWKKGIRRYNSASS